jgi:hypothetical protein
MVFHPPFENKNIEKTWGKMISSGYMCVILSIHLDHKEKAIEFSLIFSCMIFHPPFENKNIVKAWGKTISSGYMCVIFSIHLDHKEKAVEFH